uniref:Putative glycoside hydrolase n=1 Tax=viral metagenome TaxID=1070528 RepID=A0A6H1ZAW1_9ZZZZ
MNSLGLDVSGLDTKPEAPINWYTASLRGVSWATIRKSSGLNQDPMFSLNTKSAQKQGVLAMPYHYYIPKTDWKKQADAFLDGAYGDLPACLDLENYRLIRAYRGIWKAEVKPWLDYVWERTQVQPCIYTAPGYIAAYLQRDADASQYPLIVANYNVSAPYIPKPFIPGNWMAWQFRGLDDGKYYGFTGALSCALYIWNGDVANWKNVWKIGSTSTPPPTNETKQAKVIVAILNVRLWKTGDPRPLAFARRLSFRDVVKVYEEKDDRDGNTWVRISDTEWCAKRYNKMSYLEYLDQELLTQTRESAIL